MHSADYAVERCLPVQYSDGNLPNGDVECMQLVIKNRHFRPISLYLDTRYGHSYYRMRIGNRTQAFDWYQFSMTLSDL